MTTADNTPTSAQARDLLDRADHLGLRATAGASTGPVLALAMFGASTSMGTLAIASAPKGAVPALSIMMMTWLAVALAFALVAAVKANARRGFGRRWAVSMAAWGIAFIIANFTAFGLISAGFGFSIAASALIAVVTIGGIIWELRA